MERHLAAHGMALDMEAGASPLVGGLANRNYLVRVDGRPCVLRRPPDGELPPGAHDMAREHAVLDRLWRAFPLAPRGLHFSADPSVVGAPFQLIEHRAGVVVRGDAMRPGDGAEAGERLTGALVETLAALHAVDAEAVGLGGLGRPDGFVARAIEGWARRARRVTSDPPTLRSVAETAAWLWTRPIRDRSPVLLHCDFKLDNCILDPATLAPVAVVDWDMCTRGDPLFDLATLLSYWTEAGDPGCMQRLAQMPTAGPGFAPRDEVVARYAAATGRDVTDYPAFRVLAMLKLGVVFLQLHERWRAGAVADPRYAGFGALGTELLAFTREIALGRAR